MADGVIDSLSIEIGASSNTAVNNINKLVSAMKALKDATSKIDNGAAGKLRDLASALKELGDAKKINISSKLGENIGALAGAMKAVKSEDISKLRQVASAVKTFDGVKNVNINSRLANNIVEVASAVSLLEKTHFEKLTQFGNALKALSGGNISISKTLSERLKEIAAAVDTISNDTLDKIRQLTKALARLKGMGDVKIRISGVGSASAGGNNGNNPLPGGAQNSGQSNAGGNSGSGQTGVKEQIQLTLSLRKNISLIAAEWSKVGQAISSAIPGPLKLVLSIIGGIAKAVLNVAKGIAKWAFNTALNALKKIWSVIKNIAHGIVNVGKNLFKNWYDNSVFKAIANGLEKIKSIISTFGRIAFYRAVRSAIKYVTDALKEGTENAYWFSKKFGEATAYIAEAYDQMSSSNFKMSNQLGAAWSTLIATVEPIIIKLIELVTHAADAVTQFFAVLGGKKVYMHAIDYTKDWADETDKGAKKAKEWKNQLMSFDEINRLEKPSDTSGTSGKKEYDDYENMFEEIEVGGIFKRIRDMIESGEWDALGTLLGQRLNDMTNGIDWIGWGTKVGSAIQNAVTFAFNFFGTYDFYNLGAKIAEFINNAGDSINFEQLGRTTSRIRHALFNAVYGAVSNVNWKAIATHLSNYLLGWLNETAEWLSKLDTQKIAKALKDFFGNIKYAEIRDAFKTLIKTAWEKAIELKDEIFDEETKGKIEAKLKSFFEGLTWTDLKETIKTKFTELWTNLTGEVELPNLIESLNEIWPEENRNKFFEDAKEDIKTGLTTMLSNAINLIDFEALKNILLFKLGTAVFGEEWGKKHYGSGEYAGSELIKGIIAGTDSEQSELQRSLEENVVKQSTDAFGEMKKNASESLSELVGNISEFGKGINEIFSGIGTFLTGVFTLDWQTAWDGIKTYFSGVVTSVISGVSTIVSYLQMLITTIISAKSYVNDMGFGVNSAGLYGGGMSDFLGYATGGFPEDGLFMANHSELVGKFSNGKTAVANNEQITAGIASAVYDAFVEAFQTTGGSNSDREVNIYLDGKEIAKTTTKYQRQFARATG